MTSNTFESLSIVAILQLFSDNKSKPEKTRVSLLWDNNLSRWEGDTN